MVASVPPSPSWLCHSPCEDRRWAIAHVTVSKSPLRHSDPVSRSRQDKMAQCPDALPATGSVGVRPGPAGERGVDDAAQALGLVLDGVDEGAGVDGGQAL